MSGVVRIEWLNVSHAFHSHLMDPMLAEFEGVVGGVAFSLPRIPVVSNVTGEVVGEEIATAGYWVRQARETVRFADGVRALRRAGVTRMVELGPDGVLCAMARETLDEPLAGVVGGQEGVVLAAALRRDRGESEVLLGALSELWVHGASVDWPGCLPAVTRSESPCRLTRSSVSGIGLVRLAAQVMWLLLV